MRWRRFTASASRTSPGRRRTSRRSKGFRMRRPSSPMGARFSLASRKDGADGSAAASVAQLTNRRRVRWCMVLFPRGSDLHEDYAMARDCRTERIVEGSQVTALPHVAYRLMAMQTELRPARCHFIRRESAVEEADGHRAIGEMSRPDFETFLLPDSRGRATERILVYLKNFVVGQQRQREGIECREVRADEERCRLQRPQCKMEHLFIGR